MVHFFNWYSSRLSRRHALCIVAKTVPRPKKTTNHHATKTGCEAPDTQEQVHTKLLKPQSNDTAQRNHWEDMARVHRPATATRMVGKKAEKTNWTKVTAVVKTACPQPTSSAHVPLLSPHVPLVQPLTALFFFLFLLFLTPVRNGHIKRITDVDIQSSVLEIMGTNVSTNFVTCPADARKTLGIKLPFLVMIIKNLKKYFTFEVQVLDDKNVRRRFRASNYQSTTRVKPFICTMPMRLDEGWNQIQFNLSDFTRRAYGTNYIETLRVQIHANCRIRRIYFSDRLYSEEELPPEFKLFLPITKRGGDAAPQENKDPSA